MIRKIKSGEMKELFYNEYKRFSFIYKNDPSIRMTIDTDIKITDVRGQVVFATTSLGGRAIWDGNNFQGARVATGVYLVFASGSDGTQKAVTKILLIN